MTDEQATELLLKVGRMEANIENYHGDTKKALNIITGNGRPEDGVLSIVISVRRDVRELKEWINEHVCKTHEEIDKEIEELKEIKKDEAAVHKFEKKIFVKISKIIKNPLLWGPLAGLLAALTGWNKETILKIFFGAS